VIAGAELEGGEYKEAQACSRIAELLNRWASSLPSYAYETMQRAAHYASRAVMILERMEQADAMSSNTTSDRELEAALYWEGLNHATLVGLPAGSLSKIECVARVRRAASRLEQLTSQRNAGAADGAGRQAFLLGVLKFNLASLSVSDPALLTACEGGEAQVTTCEAALLERAMEDFLSAHAAWDGVVGCVELDSAAAKTMVAACLSRLGRREEAALWAARDYELRRRIQVRGARDNAR
jgi:hypothetical protein